MLDCTKSLGSGPDCSAQWEMSRWKEFLHDLEGLGQAELNCYVALRAPCLRWQLLMCCDYAVLRNYKARCQDQDLLTGAEILTCLSQ